jgi:hypothetical protein
LKVDAVFGDFERRSLSLWYRLRGHADNERNYC